MTSRRNTIQKDLVRNAVYEMKMCIRDRYYTTYAELAIGEYEHWEEEQWVDVANPDWQKFIGQLSQELYENCLLYTSRCV